MSIPDRLLGVTVMPEFLQTEGAEAVLDNLQRRAGANAIATSPYVLAPAPDGTGGREPPIDGGAGKVRLLDRPLWGRRELWVRTAPSFVADRALYRGLPYQPAEPDALTTAEGPRIAEALDAAKRRGMVAQLQVQAAIPPGYRVQFGGPLPDDRPRRRTGRRCRGASTSTPRSPPMPCSTTSARCCATWRRPIRRPMRSAWIGRNTRPTPSVRCSSISRRPPATWPRASASMSAMRRDAQATLGDAASGAAARALVAAMSGGATQAMLRLLAARPGLLELAHCKAAIATRFIATAAAALREATGGRMALIAQAFPPPFTFASGFDAAAVAPHVGAMGVKLYTMHWPMILRAWAESLGGADDPALLAALAEALDLVDGPIDAARFRYPEPEEAHPVGLAAQARKVAAVRAAAGATPVIAFSHAYGPPDDVVARFDAVWRASAGRVFVNRYGYLSDAKLDALGHAARRAPEGGHA